MITLEPKGFSSKAYEIDISQRSIMGGMANENTLHLKVKKQLQKQNKKGYVYHLETTERTQSGAHKLRILENDLAPLFNKVDLQTDFSGNITGILNLYEIKTPWFWDGARRRFLKKHKKEEGIHTIVEEMDDIFNDHDLFLENFKQSEVATLLFPPIYGSPMDVGGHQVQEKEFTDFFGELPLPLQIVTELKEHKKPDLDTGTPSGTMQQDNNLPGPKEKLGVLRTGKLHPKTFDRRAVKRYFRKLADNYRLAANVSTRYRETYDLDENHHVDHAGQLLSVELKNLFLFNQLVRVRPTPSTVAPKTVTI